MDSTYRKKLVAYSACEAARTTFKAEWTEQCKTKANARAKVSELLLARFKASGGGDEFGGCLKAYQIQYIQGILDLGGDDNQAKHDQLKAAWLAADAAEEMAASRSKVSPSTPTGSTDEPSTASAPGGVRTAASVPVHNMFSACMAPDKDKAFFDDDGSNLAFQLQVVEKE